MKIKDTDLCLDCEELFVGAEAHYCPRCGGAHSVPISAWVPPLAGANIQAEPTPAQPAAVPLIRARATGRANQRIIADHARHLEAAPEPRGMLGGRAA